jgi:hypothetical protein
MHIKCIVFFENIGETVYFNLTIYAYTTIVIKPRVFLCKKTNFHGIVVKRNYGRYIMRLLKVTTPALCLAFLLGACAEMPGTPAEAAVPVAMTSTSTPTQPVKMAAVEVASCGLDVDGKKFRDTWITNWLPDEGKTAWSDAKNMEMTRAQGSSFAVKQLAKKGIVAGNGTMGQFVLWLQNGAPTNDVPKKVQACL